VALVVGGLDLIRGLQRCFRTVDLGSSHCFDLSGPSGGQWAGHSVEGRATARAIKDCRNASVAACCRDRNAIAWAFTMQ
jgi:hypothetical protein